MTIDIAALRQQFRGRPEANEFRSSRDGRHRWATPQRMGCRFAARRSVPPQLLCRWVYFPKIKNSSLTVFPSGRLPRADDSASAGRSKAQNESGRQNVKSAADNFNHRRRRRRDSRKSLSSRALAATVRRVPPAGGRGSTPKPLLAAAQRAFTPIRAGTQRMRDL